MRDMKMTGIVNKGIATLFLLALLGCSSVPGEPRELVADGPFYARIDRVLEGDRMDVIFRTGPSGIVRFRLANAYTPAVFTDEECVRERGLVARDFVREFLGKDIFKVYDLRPGLYRGELAGRIEVKRVDLGEALIKRDLARHYSEGPYTPKRPAWTCAEAAGSDMSVENAE